MIERVAKAINDTMLQHGDYKPDELARAAIAAMREPTEEMVAVGYDNFMWGPCGSTSDDLPDANSAEIWQAMIDAALKCSIKPDEK